MNPPQVYMCSPSWTLLPPPSPYHPSGSSQCTSPKHPVSCIESGLVIRFIYDIIHVSMPFSQIIPPSSSPTESKRLFYTSVSLLLSRIQSYCYRLSKFHICRNPVWGNPPVAKVMRKEARHTQRRNRASGVPWKFSSIYPQNQSLPTLLLCALTYTSDFRGGCPPPPSLSWIGSSGPMWLFRAFQLWEA